MSTFETTLVGFMVIVNANFEDFINYMYQIL